MNAGWWRRRSAPELALAIALGSRALLGWIAAYPLLATAASLGAGSLDGGDRALFAPSGMLLLDLLRRGASALPAAGESSLLLLAIALALQTLPTALIFAAFARQAPRFETALRWACEKMGRFLLLGLIELALTALALAVAWFAWSELRPVEPTARLAVGASVGALALACVGAIAVACDLARVASIVNNASILSAWHHVQTTLIPRCLELAGGYVLLSGVGVLGVTLVARLVGAVDVAREGALRVGAAFALHFAVLALLTGLQALWVRRLGRYATPDSPRA